MLSVQPVTSPPAASPLAATAATRAASATQPVSFSQVAALIETLSLLNSVAGTQTSGTDTTGLLDITSLDTAPLLAGLTAGSSPLLNPTGNTSFLGLLEFQLQSLQLTGLGNLTLSAGLSTLGTLTGLPTQPSAALATAAGGQAATTPVATTLAATQFDRALGVGLDDGTTTPAATTLAATLLAARTVADATQLGLLLSQQLGALTAAPVTQLTTATVPTATLLAAATPVNTATVAATTPAPTTVATPDPLAAAIRANLQDTQRMALLLAGLATAALNGTAGFLAASSFGRVGADQRTASAAITAGTGVNAVA